MSETVKKHYLCRTKTAARTLFEKLKAVYTDAKSFPVEETWDFGREQTVYSVEENGKIRFWVMDEKHTAEPEKIGVTVYTGGDISGE